MLSDLLRLDLNLAPAFFDIFKQVFTSLAANGKRANVSYSASDNLLTGLNVHAQPPPSALAASGASAREWQTV